MKIDYEMGILLKRMYEMDKKPQQYHPKNFKFGPYPAGNKEIKSVDLKQLKEGNDYLIKKLEEKFFGHGLYSLAKLNKSYNNHLYYRSQLLNHGGSKKPYINFVTPYDFQKKFYNYLESSKKGYIIKNTNDKRSSSCKKINYRPFRTNNLAERTRASSVITKRPITIERYPAEMDY